MRQRGFTLFEIMIAVGILGFIGMLTFGVVGRSMDGRERAEQITTHYHGVRQAMLRMSREIEMAYVTAHRDCEDPRTRSIFASANASGGMRLDFTAFSHYKVRADANESDEEELSYYVDDNPDDKKNMALIRRSQPRVDNEPREGGVEQVLAPNVKKLEFEFYDSKEDRWVDEWNTTNMDYRDRMPMFVSIKLTVVDPQGKDEVFVTKTRVMLRNAILIAGTGFTRCAD
ncbi:MAG: type II secretion system protein GspJ [Myxococcota bacterium]